MRKQRKSRGADAPLLMLGVFGLIAAAVLLSNEGEVTGKGIAMPPHDPQRARRLQDRRVDRLLDALGRALVNGDTAEAERLKGVLDKLIKGSK